MARKSEKSSNSNLQLPHTLGDYAYQVIQEQYRRILKQEADVLADTDPEALHQMRVGTRRLRTALQVFEMAIILPKNASAKRLRKFARILGEVRDLDVQLASLADDYRPQIKKREQKQLDQVAEALAKRRKVAVSTMQEAIDHSLYQDLKAAFSSWLKKPKYTAISQLPISSVLPDLLSPLLTQVMLHPGWLVATEQVSDQNSATLHDLRKACKHMRYQAEFFIPFYGTTFENWVKEIKDLQDRLGAFQDTQVLLELLTTELGDRMRLPNLQTAIDQTQAGALSTWDELRQKYLDDGFRYHLHQMLLQPTIPLNPVHPELVEAG